MKTFIMWLFSIEDKYMVGRGDGWKACEDMVISRIEKHYPEMSATLIEELVQ